MSDTFCPWPWNYQAIRNNGDIRICCQANVSPSKGIVKDSQGNTFNAATASLDAARNAPLIKNVRKNMINGVWSDECVRCKEEEKHGLDSARIYALEKWKITVDDIKPYTKEDGEIDTKKSPTISYDLRFGNLCNLACRMCGPTDSHTWYEQWSKYTGVESFHDTHGVVKLIRNSVGRLTTSEYDWHNSEIFWNQIENDIENIQHVYIIGGEPLMIERHYDFLKKCVEKNVAKNIVLEYNTNGTLLPNRAIELWKEFKEVQLGISIDGIGSVVEYQRWPAKWSQLYNNLKKLNSIAHVQPNITCWLAVTVTVYNVLHIADMVEWKLFESGLDKINSHRIKTIINPHIAHRGLAINIKILPKEFKLEVVERYKKSIETLTNLGADQQSIERATSIYNSILKYMNSEDLSEHLPEFIKFTKFLDKERNQSIVKILPSLGQYFTS